MKTLFLAFVLFVNCPFFYAQNTGSVVSGNNYALLVSVSNYEEQLEFSNLPTVKEGISTLEKELLEMYDFEVETLHNPSKDELYQSMQTYRKKVFGENDQLLVLFSGHGTYKEFEHKGYFVPSSGDPIDLTTLENVVTLIPCEHILLAIDACFSGTILQEINYQGSSRLRRPGETNKSEKEIKIAKLLRNKSRLVLTSGGKERTRAEVGGSPFIRTIIRTLKEAYTNDYGIVTYKDLEANLELLSPTPRYGTLQGHDGGSFVFYTENLLNKTSLSEGLEPPIRTRKPEIDLKDKPPVAEVQLITISGGKYRMGRPKVSLDANSEGEHLVRVSDFSIGITEVTFEEFDAFCKATSREMPDDEGWGRGRRPVINVSWYDAASYCNWLSTIKGLEKVYTLNGSNVDADMKANGYRLPTEAEWEFAAKQNTSSSASILFGNGSSIADPSKLNFDASSGYNLPYAKTGKFRNRTVPCASLNSKNSLGIFDLSGNVSEWCHDIYSPNFYSNSPIDNPIGVSTGYRRVIRGGNYSDTAEDLIVYARDSAKATQRDRRVGFRIAKGNL